jgi:hypothetical protein
MPRIPNTAAHEASLCRIQTSGLGGMKPNTVVVGWPNSWRKKEDDGTQVFVNAIRYAAFSKPNIFPYTREVFVEKVQRKYNIVKNNLCHKRLISEFLSSFCLSP